MPRAYSEYIGVRIPPFLYNLVGRLSKEIGISRSEMVRKAIITWLETLPENELPMDLKIPITRVLVDHKIGIIRDLRYLYHARKKAENMTKKLKIDLKTGQFPPHVITLLKKLEGELIEIVNNFDRVLMQIPVEIDPGDEV